MSLSLAANMVSNNTISSMCIGRLLAVSPWLYEMVRVLATVYKHHSPSHMLDGVNGTTQGDKLCSHRETVTVQHCFC